MRSPVGASLRVGAIALSAQIVLSVVCGAAMADVSIVLKNDFISKYKNRATLEAVYTVEHAHAHPNAPSKDGDLHFAGTSPDIGLACVAEIMNATGQDAAVQRVHDAESSHQPLAIEGAWRLWPEHANGGQDFTQDAAVAPIVNTNPPHVFELHPVTGVDGIDVRSGLTPIEGYEPKDPEVAFAAYEAHACEIIPRWNSTTLVTSTIGYNYVQFRLHLLEDPTHVLDDGGLSVYGSVFPESGADDEPIVSRLRFVFLPGSPPLEQVKQLHAGDNFTVLGIPRIDLALVEFRRKKKGAYLRRSLPYEILVVGVASPRNAPIP
ncbi:MAG: hypothetical protein ABL977_15635 [Candidatus Eisenbacteria bacterium]